LKTRSAEIVGPSDTRTPEVTKQLPNKNYVHRLQMMIVSEPEYVLLGHDEARLFFSQYASRFQSCDATAHSFEREVKEPGEGGPRNAPFDVIGFDRVDAGISFIELRIVHDVNHVGVQNGMDDQEIERIKFAVVTKHFAD